jgi:hypothetical protein
MPRKKAKRRAEVQGTFDPSHQPASVEQPERLTSEIASVVTIYVELLDEGTTVWRPVAAARIGEGIYRILSANSEHPDEAWEFDQGDLVHCVDRELSGENGKILVRVADAPISSEAG